MSFVILICIYCFTHTKVFDKYTSYLVLPHFLTYRTSTYLKVRILHGCHDDNWNFLLAANISSWTRNKYTVQSLPLFYHELLTFINICVTFGKKDKLQGNLYTNMCVYQPLGPFPFSTQPTITIQNIDRHKIN